MTKGCDIEMKKEEANGIVECLYQITAQDFEWRVGGVRENFGKEVCGRDKPNVLLGKKEKMSEK